MNKREIDSHYGTLAKYKARLRREVNNVTKRLAAGYAAECGVYPDPSNEYKKSPDDWARDLTAHLVRTKAMLADADADYAQ